MTAETESLDRQIAEALGLWSPDQECPNDDAYTSAADRLYCPVCRSEMKAPGFPDFAPAPHLMKCPAYSSDIAAAFQVVEAMRERGWFLVLETHRIRTTAQFWRIVRGFARTQVPREYADTPALAIVRASLAALKAGEGAHGG